ncbi:hypothetical protein [Mycobacterium malmoense]|uniref:hypothetical protein n=1 Tax=Mycobacterium malmoense TaxID=1780 RepID=UPI0008F9280D|nr:hypothetical protein [Mycobacterium malmoense]OIN80546.1 hypothetical protein BMG05_12380 [Mycobacterium malmoense]
MHTLARLGTHAATLTLVITPAATFEIVRGAAEGATTVVLDGDLRRCDFSLVTTAPMVPRPGLGTGSALIHTTGSTAIAEVHLVDAPEPGAHFDVGLIQEPRPASATCGPGDPGTAFTGMDTDAAGSATVTIQDTIRPGTTGVWVIVERPNANSQNPAEFYTSEFVVPV